MVRLRALVRLGALVRLPSDAGELVSEELAENRGVSWCLGDVEPLSDWLETEPAEGRGVGSGGDGGPSDVGNVPVWDHSEKCSRQQTNLTCKTNQNIEFCST